jgi:hypothetical protein
MDQRADDHNDQQPEHPLLGHDRRGELCAQNATGDPIHAHDTACGPVYGIIASKDGQGDQRCRNQRQGF